MHYAEANKNWGFLTLRFACMRSRALIYDIHKLLVGSLLEKHLETMCTAFGCGQDRVGNMWVGSVRVLAQADVLRVINVICAFPPKLGWVSGAN